MPWRPYHFRHPKINFGHKQLLFGIPNLGFLVGEKEIQSRPVLRNRELFARLSNFYWKSWFWDPNFLIVGSKNQFWGLKNWFWRPKSYFLAPKGRLRLFCALSTTKFQDLCINFNEIKDVWITFNDILWFFNNIWWQLMIFGLNLMKNLDLLMNTS